MSVESHDPRDRLVREKYFSLRPKPLERYLWQQGLPQAAERVFWLHWEEGMRAGDWCSQLPLRRVASLCCIDTSTVTRAYQLLKTLGLIRREDPGRDPGNPFQQATAITEVRIPRALLTELARSPNRGPSRMAPCSPGATPEVSATPPTAAPLVATAPVAAPPAAAHFPSRQEIQALWGRASAAEKSRYFEASRNGRPRIDFDADTALTGEDQAQLIHQLQQMAPARAPMPAHTPGTTSKRRLTPLELARTRRKLTGLMATHQVQETLRQVAWAVEEGALQRFDTPLALNIALKKIREGAWTRPHRMPPNWLRAYAETCSAA